MAELEDIKKQLEESNKVVETMKAEKIAQEKAAVEAEAKKIQETIKAQADKIALMEKELADAKTVKEQSTSKGVVQQTVESKNPIEGYMLERADSGKGFQMYKTDFSGYKRMQRD
jgi:cell division septum initiation protein DivIVA